MHTPGAPTPCTSPPRPQSKLASDTGWQPYMVNFVSGTVAAVSATVLTQPFDVARTQIQLRMAPQARGAGPANPLAQLTALGMLRHIGASQGVRGLLAGAVPRVTKRALQTALIWVFYEEIMGRLTRPAPAAVVEPARPGA